MFVYYTICLVIANPNINCLFVQILKKEKILKQYQKLIEVNYVFKKYLPELHFVILYLYKQFAAKIINHEL